MANSDHGICLDEKNQEQPTDKKRAQDSSSKNIPGSGPQQKAHNAEREHTNDIPPPNRSDDGRKNRRSE